MKVGRTALDDETRRRIERQNPDIEFDWPRILKGGGAPPTELRPPMDVRRSRQPEGRRETPPSRQQQPPPPKPAESPTPPPPAQKSGSVDVDDAPPPPPARAQSASVDADDEELKNAIDAPPPNDVTPPIAEPIDTPAHARLGAEGVAQLRSRYAEIRARIAERVDDAGRRDELGLAVEQLNPDTWRTPDEVTAGLEQYEAVLAALRDVAGRRRRKRRRGGRRDQAGPSPAQDAGGAPDAAPEDEPGDDDPGQDDSGGV